MFDINLDGSIEKDEMYNLMMMFLEVFIIKYNKGNDVSPIWKSGPEWIKVKDQRVPR